MTGETYASVRALERGLDLLQALAARGKATPGELARDTGLNRTTIYRLLETLRQRGFVSCNGADGSFRLDLATRQLGDGYKHADDVCRVVAPALGRLLPKIVWPSDFATFANGTMVIRETTHPFSPYSIHRSVIGRTRSLMRSALGRAMMAGASAQQRRSMAGLALASGHADAAEVADHVVERWVAEIGRRGYAWSVNGTEDGISAIALPIRAGSVAVGAINIIFFTSAMAPEAAAARHLADLRATVAEVETDLSGDRPASGPDPC